jgi:hypothetical protein
MVALPAQLLMGVGLLVVSTIPQLVGARVDFGVPWPAPYGSHSLHIGVKDVEKSPDILKACL